MDMIFHFLVNALGEYLFLGEFLEKSEDEYLGAYSTGSR